MEELSSKVLLRIELSSESAWLTFHMLCVSPQPRQAMTGSPEISARPLLRYYAPLIVWLEKRVEEEDIPLGW